MARNVYNRTTAKKQEGGFVSGMTDAGPLSYYAEENENENT